MSSFFKPNIDRTGRIMRLIWGAFCLIIGIVVGVKWDWVPGVAIIVAGVFSWFEALRGWCILRACGIKTKH